MQTCRRAGPASRRSPRRAQSDSVARHIPCRHPKLRLARFGGHFPLSGEGSTKWKKHPRSYPLEFRQNVIELARAGQKPEELAAKFELAPQTVRNWVKQADIDGDRRNNGLTSAESEEVTKLRKRIRQLETERDILSEAASWFARETDSIPLPGLRIRESASGPLTRRYAVLCAGRLDQRLLRVAETSAIPT